MRDQDYTWSVENLFLRTKLPLLALHSRMTTKSSETAQRKTFPLEDSRQEKVWHLAGEGARGGRGQGGGVLLELGSKDIPEEPISGYQYLASSAVTASGCRGAVRDREETVTSWGRREGQRRRASQHQVTDMPACVSEVS